MPDRWLAASLHADGRVWPAVVLAGDVVTGQVTAQNLLLSSPSASGVTKFSGNASSVRNYEKVFA